MALEPVVVDDLVWADIMSAIRARIPGASKGLWTLYAPVDPGVSLLELFAWALEQRLYWLDQVPDPLLRGVITLLGQAPRPVQVAGTVLALRRDPLAFEVLVAPVEARLADPAGRIVFTTDTGLTVLPVGRWEVYSAGQDLTADVIQGREPEVLRDAGADLRIVLHLAQSLPAQAPNQPFALLFDLNVPAKIAPQWSPMAVNDVPPPAELEWLYPGQAAALKRFPMVEDGTAGMRRPGVVRLAAPGDWMPDQPANPVTHLIPYSIVLHAKKAAFSSPPRLRKLEPNAVVARHRKLTQEHAIRVEWLPLPNNTVVLPEKERPPIEATVRVSILERDGQSHEWTPVSDLSFLGPADRGFVTDRQAGLLRFGNGLTGRLPVPQSGSGANVKFRYEAGGGSKGNLGSGLQWKLPVHLPLAGTNPVASVGGEEPETVEEARLRVAAELSQVERAVTAKDHETIATASPGIAIARAHAAVGFHPCYPCAAVPGAVTVFLVPDAPRAAEGESENFTFVAAPQPDPGALEVVRQRLEKARLVGSEVYVLGPRYRAVTVRLQVNAEPANAAQVRARLRRRLRDYLDPLVGGEEGAGWPFGAPLYPSEMQKVAQRVLGSEGEVRGVGIGLDANPSLEDCKKIEIGLHELVYLASLSVELNRQPLEEGGLR